MRRKHIIIVVLAIVGIGATGTLWPLRQQPERTRDTDIGVIFLAYTNDSAGRAHGLRGFLLLLPLVISGCCGVSQRSLPEQAEVRAHPNLIAHVAHNGASFSIAVDQRDSAYLRIIVPERFSPPAPLPERTVKVRVLMTDDSRKEGIAQKLRPTVANAGGADRRIERGRATAA
jgi:hypothetical protein